AGGAGVEDDHRPEGDDEDQGSPQEPEDARFPPRVQDVESRCPWLRRCATEFHRQPTPQKNEPWSSTPFLPSPPSAPKNATYYHGGAARRNGRVGPGGGAGGALAAGSHVS